MRRFVSVSLIFLAGIGALIPAAAGAKLSAPVEAGIPAQVVDFVPDSVNTRTYETLDYTEDGNSQGGPTEGTTEWRVVMGTGNAAELWLAANQDGRLFDMGGRYINFSDDRGLTWKSVRPLEPLVNSEGSVVTAPNGDILGVTWDPYAGDRVVAYKYSKAEDEWYYNYDPVHTPFWDRPAIGVIPGPFTTPIGEVPYLSFINGLPHDPWYYSIDGLNYVVPSSPQVDKSQTTPINTPLNIDASAAFDWIQPNHDGLFASFTPLGGGRALLGRNSMFSPADLKWHTYTPPAGTPQLPTRSQVDSLGRLHTVANEGDGFDYKISTDGGNTWNVVHAPEGRPGDFQSNASVGIAAVWAIKGKQDLLYKFDISGDQPELIRKYVVGLGDDPRTGGVGFYGASGGHRYDFSSVVIFPNGKVGLSFMDSTTTMPFPTLTLPVVAPGLAIELGTTLSGDE